MNRKFNLRPDPVDTRDYLFAAKVAKAPDLPAKVDLRSDMPPVYDQSYLGSCTSNAIAAGRSYMTQVRPHLTFSRLYLYYFARELMGTVNEDSGAYIRDALKVLNKRGVCVEEVWPYIPERFTECPDDVAETWVDSFRISEYHRILTPPELKQSLAEGFPVVLGICVYDSFVNNTYTPLPDKQKESLLGGHALLAVGYDDKHVIVRNSWGPEFGDQGYCYMPYAYFVPDLVFDMWTFRG